MRGRPITLANIYRPNNQVPFFRQNAKAHLVCIWNPAPWNLLERTIWPPHRCFRRLHDDTIQSLETIKKRTPLPTPSPHGADSKPDGKGLHLLLSHPQQLLKKWLQYIFLSHAELHYLESGTIQPMILSVHYPITVTLTIPDKNTIT